MAALKEKLTQAVRALGSEQIELKAWYPFDAENHKKMAIDLEYYLFIPLSLGVNKRTHPSRLFYRHRKLYLRFRSPLYALEQLYLGEKSKFIEVRRAYNDCLVLSDEVSFRRLRQHCQHFGCLIQSSLSRQASFIGKLRRAEKIDVAVEDLLRHADGLVDCYRTWLKTLGPMPDEDDPYIHLWYLDEYMSLLVERYCFYVMDLFKEITWRSAKHFTPKILELTAKEQRYRETAGYLSVLKENSDNEKFMYRYRALKRYSEQLLFLDIDQKKESVVAEQMLMIVAAGLAMAFATSVAIVAQMKLGVVSVSFFWAMVISYMFKDRIKEISRDRLKRWFLKDAYDHSFHLFSDFSAGRLAVVKESFSFVKTKDVDEAVHALRGRSGFNLIADGDQPERIIRYRKNISVHSKAFKKVYDRYNVRGLTDITRLHVEHFIRNVSQSKDVAYLSLGDQVVEVPARKVYHLNIVVRQRGDVGDRLSHYRVILNHLGVKRVEVVSEPRDKKSKRGEGSSDEVEEPSSTQ